MVLIYTLLINFFAHASSSDKIGTGNFSCDKILRQVHVELAIANVKDKAAQRPLSQLSRRGPVEHEIIHRNPPVAGHAVSLGSGPDVFRLLQDFPLVPNLHMVDMLTGQSSPGKIIREIEQRLNAIGRVELLHPGFVDDYSWAILDDHQLAYRQFSQQYDSMGEKQDYPRIWRLNWTTNALGGRETLVYLHLLDFDNPTHLQKLVFSFAKSGGLMGVLITGTTLQSKVSTMLLLDQLEPGASFAYEIFYSLTGQLQKLGSEDTGYQNFLDLVSTRSDLIHQVLMPRANAEGEFNNHSRMHILFKASANITAFPEK